jgi:hypothetical protein
MTASVFDDLHVLTRLFREGEPGVDFLVVSGEEGCGYESTPLERSLRALQDLLVGALAEDPSVLSPAILATLIESLADLDPGVGRTRTRLLACAGDYGDVVSTACEFQAACLQAIGSALAKLEKRGAFPLDHVHVDLLARPLDGTPFIEQIFSASLQCFRRPRIAPLLRRQIAESEREAKLARKQRVRAPRTFIDDGRDGLIPDPPAPSIEERAPLFLNLLNDRIPQVVRQAEQALVALGVDAVPYLVDALDDAEDRRRPRVLSILELIARSDLTTAQRRTFLSQLAKLRRDPEPHVAARIKKLSEALRGAPRREPR